MQTRADVRLRVLSIGLALFALALAWAIAFVVSSPPRSFVFWVTLDFVSFAIIVACLLGLNAAARAKSGYRPSGAVMAGVGAIFTLDVLITLISIVLYGSVIVGSAQRDLYFAAWVAGVNGLFFIAAAFLYGHDIAARVQEAPVLQARSDLQGCGDRLDAVIDRLSRLGAGRGAVQMRLDRVMRDLRTLRTEIVHTSGGGLGSWESGGGKGPVISAGDLEASLGRIAGALDEFAASEEAQWSEKVSAIEKSIGSLQSAVSIPNFA
jgi:hypothetical protein